MNTHNDNAVGFLSYAHIDDEADGGRIRKLARLIQSEYRVLTGEVLDIFVDKSDLRWGTNWKERIDGSLQTTTFFIPVLSPSFFASYECRREFFEFFNTARSLGVPSYLLAIRYAPVDDLVSNSTDQAKAIAAQTQYKNWEQLRLVDENSAEHRAAINDIANELRTLMRVVQDSSSQEPVTPSPRRSAYETEPGDVMIEQHVADDDPYGDQPSTFDLIAELSIRSEAWRDSMDEFKAASESFSQIMTNGTAEINEISGATNPFAARTVILRRVANELEGPANQIEQAGEEYMKKLLEIDPSFRALAELGNAQTTPTAVDARALHEAQESLGRLMSVSQETNTAVRTAIQNGRDLARASRDLRAPLKKFETGSQNLLDGQAIIENWYRLFSSIAWLDKDTVQ